MTAIAHERPETMTETQTEFSNGPDLDEVLWQVWKAMELPEGYRAEIIEGAIEVSPTARRSHGLIANRPAHMRARAHGREANPGMAGKQRAQLLARVAVRADNGDLRDHDRAKLSARPSLRKRCKVPRHA